MLLGATLDRLSGKMRFRTEELRAWSPVDALLSERRRVVRCVTLACWSTLNAARRLPSLGGRRASRSDRNSLLVTLRSIGWRSVSVAKDPPSTRKNRAALRVSRAQMPVPRAPPGPWYRLIGCTTARSFVSRCRRLVFRHTLDDLRAPVEAPRTCRALPSEA